MRVLQLIDSLDAGGAERVAVTYANSLSEYFGASFLCSTRKKGILEGQLNKKVSYLFLGRTHFLDISALLKLRRFVKKNKITIIHAHTTSFFISTLLKIIYPNIKIVWHEHHGNRINTKRNQNLLLYFCSFFFDKIITVNKEQQLWCKNKLLTKDVDFLANFIDIEEFAKQVVKRNNTIVCLANLRYPKNHLNLLKSFKEVNKIFPEWKLQLIGKDYQDTYSNELKKYILKANLSGSVDFLGSSNKVANFLSPASIGVLSSDIEGLPMALLEYGASGLAVVATNVGYCEDVIKTYGKIVPSNNSKRLSEELIYYIKNKNERIKDSSDYKNHIIKNYSKNSVLPILLNYYKELL